MALAPILTLREISLRFGEALIAEKPEKKGAGGGPAIPDMGGMEF